MATDEEVARLRRMTDVAVGDTTYTYEVLAEFVDSNDTLEAAAGAVWSEKAAALAGLVDVTESGSSRRLSQLHSQALEMRKHFAPDDVTDDTGGRSFTVAIERV
jgi:hypothetical protein